MKDMEDYLQEEQWYTDIQWYTYIPSSSTSTDEITVDGSEIPNNHLTCMKPVANNGTLTISITGDRRISEPSTVRINWYQTLFLHHPWRLQGVSPWRPVDLALVLEPRHPRRYPMCYSCNVLFQYMLNKCSCIWNPRKIHGETLDIIHVNCFFLPFVRQRCII